MNRYLISYDLRNPNRDYSKLYNRLEKFEKFEKVNESVWIIQSSSSIDAITVAIMNNVDTDDKVFILNQSWDCRALGYDTLEFLKFKNITQQ